MQVSEVMSPNPFAVAVTASVRQVMRVMSDVHVRHVPVVEDHALVGIMSERDLRSLLPTFLERFDAPELAERILAQPVSNVMSADVVSVGPEDDLVEAIDLLIEQQIGAVPVVEPGSKRLVGILSYVDALRATRDLITT